jgi:hypothetical protein
MQPYLCRDGVRPRGEELGDAGGVEAVLGEPDRGPEPRAAGPHHHRVIRVIDHRVRRLHTSHERTKINRRILGTKPSHHTTLQTN